MTEHVYECMFILDTEQYNRNPEEVPGQIVKAIEELGGTVRVSRVWGEERKLTFPIKKRKRGVYWLVYYRLDTEKTKELNRQFRLMNSVLRFLPIVIDERLEEALVNHALDPPKPVDPEVKPSTDGDVFDDADADDDEQKD